MSASGSQFKSIVSALRASRQHDKILAYWAAIVVVIAGTAYMQIKLNAWNQPFYDAISHKHLDIFIEQIGVFVILACILLVLNVAQTWLGQRLKLTLREGLTQDLVENWLTGQRAYRLTSAGEIGANPDQRLTDDAKHMCDLSTDLGIGLLQSSMLLVSFVGVLWSLSENVSFTWGTHTFVIPGFMVWCALLYSLIASLLSWFVGRPLVDLNAHYYGCEADLRFALVRVNEQIVNITLHNGEADEKAHVKSVFDEVVRSSRQVIGALTRLTWVTSSYGWFTIVAPLIVAAPIYFHGAMTFGQLMVVVGAFNQVQQALRWFVDNFPIIADWRATLLRIANFRTAVIGMDDVDAKTPAITFVQSTTDAMRIENLSIAAPVGKIKLDAAEITLKPSERVHISGDSGASKTLLFHTLAHMWPWGSGRMTHPDRADMMFVAERAYIPPGTLRAAILYPAAAMQHTDAEVVAALRAVGLENIVGELDKIDRWDKRLTEDEKQCLAFARVLLQKPQWLVLDEAFGVLDPASCARIKNLLMQEFAGAAIVSIGQIAGENHFACLEVRAITDMDATPQSPAADIVQKSVPGKAADKVAAGP